MEEIITESDRMCEETDHPTTTPQTISLRILRISVQAPIFSLIQQYGTAFFYLLTLVEYRAKL